MSKAMPKSRSSFGRKVIQQGSSPLQDISTKPSRTSLDNIGEREVKVQTIPTNLRHMTRYLVVARSGLYQLVACSGSQFWHWCCGLLASNTCMRGLNMDFCSRPTVGVHFPLPLAESNVKPTTRTRPRIGRGTQGT